MSIQIHDHITCGTVLARSRKFNTIAVANSHEILKLSITQFSKELLTLIFDDIDCPLSGCVAPSEDDVERAIQFAKGKEFLMFTCPNGRTRSSALAYVCRCLKDTPERAIGILRKGWHYPNFLVVKHAAKLMGNYEILDAYYGFLGIKRLD